MCNEIWNSAKDVLSRRLLAFDDEGPSYHVVIVSSAVQISLNTAIGSDFIPIDLIVFTTSSPISLSVRLAS